MNEFGQKIPIRDENDAITGHRPSVVRRITRFGLPGSFGKEKHRKVIGSFLDGDIIAVRPQGLSKKRELTVTAQDLYGILLRRKASVELMKKAGEAKQKKAERKISARIAATDRRLRLQAKAEKGAGQ